MDNRIQLYGIAPVQQCLLHQNRKCYRLLVKEKSSSPRIREITGLARNRSVQVEKVDAHKLSNLAGTKLNQGVVLTCGELQPQELDPFLEETRRKPKRLLIALDQIEDPQNVGAIIRSAAFLGAGGLISLKKHSAPFSAVVSKASAGALEYFPIVQVANLSECLQRLKKEAFTVAGATSGDGSIDFREFPVTDDMVLVLGNEGQGLRNLTRKRCDYLIRIPGEKSTESLNVSAAAAILIQHLIR
ncbi:MAG: 23S rRNA (guanosine(2251)-2'-O)-methyltransferase RlmB [Proteobacteria bacterium]|nr:23S rRNA (guanosine(2251)-2'-O)-methyltransferase RlmB [Pseudomonadota bacterium]